MADHRRFYYLTADREDIYFTQQLIKLNFEKKLYFDLRNKETGYEHVYFFEMANGNEVEVYSYRREAAEEYKNYVEPEKKGWLGKKVVPTEIEEKISNNQKKFCIRQKNEFAKKTIENMIRINGNDNYAFVMIGEIFSKFYPNDAELNSLDALLDANRYAKGTSFFFIGNLDEDKCPKIPGNDIERIVWNHSDKKQLKYLLERVNITLADYMDEKNIKKIRKVLIDLFDSDDRRELFGERIGNKKDLYDFLGKGRNMSKLIEMANSEDWKE